MSDYLQKIVYLTQSDYDILAQGTEENPASVTKNGITLTNLDENCLYITDGGIVNSDISGIIGVPHGGTGKDTLLSGQVLVGNGENPITTIVKTSANTANTLVERDVNGDFSARNITMTQGNIGSMTLSGTTIAAVTAINTSGGNALLGYKPSGWTGVSSSQWGVGTVDIQGVIRSNNSDLLHSRAGTNSVILDAGNYTDYTVTKTGSGASGSWGIDITGTAAKATADASGNTITTTYAKLASPALTGTPTAPTAANGTNTTQIATTAFVNNTLAYANAMTFKGTLGTGGTITSLPASHNAGDTYRVITAGTWAGKYCEVGTLIICIKDGTAAADADWTSVETNEDGAVIGPASSTDNAIVRFDGNTGRVVQNSKAIIDDNGYITIPHTANKGGAFEVTYSSTIDFWLGVGSGNTNHGLYDVKADKWILSAGTDNKWDFDGNSTTATTATNLSAAPTIASGGTATVNLSANTAYTLTVGGKSVIFKTPADSNTDTKVNYTLAATTKAYLMASSDAPTSTATGREAKGDSNVYLTATAGELSAVRHSYNVSGTEKAYSYYNTTLNSIDFVFV